MVTAEVSGIYDRTCAVVPWGSRRSTSMKIMGIALPIDQNIPYCCMSLALVPMTPVAVINVP